MSFPDDINEGHWIQQVRALLNRSRRQSGYNRYTQPAPDAENQQSPWNSALYALVYRWFDLDMAGDELKSAVAHQVQAGDDAGMVPGRVFWASPGSEMQHADLTAPPLLAYATVQVYHFSGDTSLLERLYPKLVAWHEWFDRRRDDDADNLVRIDYPDEFIVGGGAVNVNAIRAADLDALAHIASDMDDPGEAAHWETRAKAVEAALHAQPVDLYERVNATLLTMMVGRGVSPSDAAEMVSRVSAQANDKLFPWLEGSDNPISMVDNWLIYLALRRYGFHALASDIAEKSFRLVEENGFHQFYDSVTGKGLGTPDHGTSALALDLLFREKQGKIPKPKCLQEFD